MQRLVALDRRWIFLVIGLAVAAPFLFHWTLPVGMINDRTKNVYNHVEAAKPGDAILICFSYGPAAMPELHPMALAVLRHALKKNLRVVAMSMTVQGSLMADDALEKVAKDFPNKKDGTDFVNLGFKPGGYLVVLGMGDNIPKTYPADSKKRPLGTLPVMRGLTGLKDLRMVLDLASSRTPDTWILFGHERFKADLALGVTAVMATDYYPYLSTKQILGLLNGLRGAADYEALIGRQDNGFLGMTSQSVAHLLIILFVVLGNIGYFATRKRP
jgi:hypothetical protein